MWLMYSTEWLPNQPNVADAFEGINIILLAQKKVCRLDICRKKEFRNSKFNKKKEFENTFLHKYLQMSKKSCIFAPSNEKMVNYKIANGLWNR